MNLKLVSDKLNRILNGTDAEVSALGFSNPTDFRFVVETQGFHLDHIRDDSVGTNFIPVFVASMGGNRNPVPDLKQGNYTIPITFYAPVRFKNEIMLLEDYLVDVFVGRRLNYGTNDDPVHCVSNLSVAQFGEIVDLDLREFAKWVENIYQKQIDVMEPFISMQMTLYLSNSAEDIIYGNDVEAILSVDMTTVTDETFNLASNYSKGDYVIYLGDLYRAKKNITAGPFNSSDWDEINTTESVIFASGSLQSNSQTVSEQAIGTNEAVSLPIGTAYGVSYAVYAKSDSFFQMLLDKWFDGDVQLLRLDATINLGDLTFTRRSFIQSINMPIVKGEPLTITFTFTPAVDD